MSDNSINLKAQSDFFAFIDKAKSVTQATNREVLNEIGRRLVDYSAVGDPGLWKAKPPKGYVPGLFINNWQVGRDAPPTAVQVAGPDASGSGSLDRLQKLGRWTVGHVYYFTNNLPYAYKLETGLHSTQVPPGGMVGRVQLEFPEIVKVAANKVALSKMYAAGYHP